MCLHAFAVHAPVEYTRTCTYTVKSVMGEPMQPYSESLPTCVYFMWWYMEPDEPEPLTPRATP